LLTVDEVRDLERPDSLSADEEPVDTLPEDGGTNDDFE
jgi:hypothetical protein